MQVSNRTLQQPNSECYDTATLLTFVIPLAAPGASVVLSPLSSLLAYSLPSIPIYTMYQVGDNTLRP